MSNLLKQYYVTNPTGTVRVIDSNKRADIAIKEHAVIGFQPLSFSSFDGPSDEPNENEKVTEGNESTSISEENEVAVAGKIQDMLDAAQKQADSIVLDAQNQAKRILIEANKKAERIFDDNKKKDENYLKYKEKSSDIRNRWDEMQELLSFYIEHDELEKVETQLAVINGQMESKLYDEAVVEIERCKFILEHIADKTAFNIKNIF